MSLVSKTFERERAIALRSSGLTYSEILAKVPVAKSTLADWFHKASLAKRQDQRMTVRKRAALQRGAQKLREQKLLRNAATHVRAGQEAHLLLKSMELPWAVGTALYWAEGAKAKEWGGKERFIFTNTDPQMILLVRAWLLRYCSVEASDIQYAIWIHQDADIPAAQEFWTSLLGIARTELRTYLKRHNPKPSRKRVGYLYHGTMRISVRRSSELFHRVGGWIRAMATHCGVG